MRKYQLGVINIKVRKLYIFLAVALILIGCGYAYLFEVYNSGETLFAQDKTTDLEKEDIYVTIEKSKGWAGEDKITVGGQYDGKIYNNSDIDYTEWRVVINGVPKGSYIDSSWDGRYEEKEGQIIVRCDDYNADVLNNTVRPFGMVLYTPFQYKATDIELYMTPKSSMTESPVFWIIQVFTAVTVVSTIIVLVFDYRIKRLRKKSNEYKNIIEQSLKTFANIIDAKDQYTCGHSERVAYYSREIARRMELSDDERERVYYTAFLHDIGKIAIPDAILQKKGKLNDEERSVIQTHPTVGGDILEDFTSVEGICEGARYHHERYDGTGYNEGRKGEEIPLFARIICVADSYDAMASSRCYRPDLDPEYILSELERCSGTQFDPAIASIMIDMINDGFAPVTKIPESEEEEE